MPQDRDIRRDHSHSDPTTCPRCRAICSDFSAGDPQKLSVCKSIFARLGDSGFSERDFERAMTESFGDDWRRRAIGAIVHQRMGELHLSDTIPKKS